MNARLVMATGTGKTYTAFQKTIVFCVDTDHAARMRQALLNENQHLGQQQPRYVMRITGDDADGQAQLGNFIDPEARYPVPIGKDLDPFDLICHIACDQPTLTWN